MPKRRNESSDHDADHHNDAGNDTSSSGNKQSSKHNRSSPADCSEEDEPGSSNSSSIPIFLKKTYRMIETCDPSICSWTEDGEMFVVKNPVR